MMCDHQCLKDAFLMKATTKQLIKLQLVKFPFQIKKIIRLYFFVCFFSLSLCGCFFEPFAQFALSLLV